jgi:hypothetical protein
MFLSVLFSSRKKTERQAATMENRWEELHIGADKRQKRKLLQKPFIQNYRENKSIYFSIPLNIAKAPFSFSLPPNKSRNQGKLG